MPRRTLNHLDARKEAEAASKAEGTTKAKAKKKATKSTRVKKKSAASKVVRMRVRWAVFNDNMKRIAVFDYPHRTDADRKAEDLIGRGKGHHIVHAIKEPMPEEEQPATKT